ncbi:MAG: 5'/3'-nucleotidase SurE [Rhodopirellula sp.]|nr:5'/3'-nucleotidase SurE [Rhodopirellula sp.]
MKFLVTNDDGVDAPGIRALAAAASQIGEVLVVAPEEAHSGCGHRVTTHEAIPVREYATGWWAIGGTPADCTRVGLREIAADCDWVLAGVNAGANLGVDIFMSGTVAAVREGALLGCPGIAFSHYRAAGGKFNWEFAVENAVRAIKRIMADPTAAEGFWNVNLPDLSVGSASSGESPGRLLNRTHPHLIDCPVGRHHLPVDFVNDRGKLTYRGVYQDRPSDPGDDVDVCFGGDIAVSRLSIW